MFKRSCIVGIGVLIITIGTINPVAAQGEHSRRAAAELQVIRGDVRKLSGLTESENSALHFKGLKQRIDGGFSALDILFRLADQETGQVPRNYSADIMAVRKLLSNNQLAELKTKLAKLQEQFPLKIPAIAVTEKNTNQALENHKKLCMACHDNPDLNVERPAYNLYQQALTESELEFFARMLVGVRGDRVTGIDNPFSDLQLASLIHLYKQGKP